MIDSCFPLTRGTKEACICLILTTIPYKLRTKNSARSNTSLLPPEIVHNIAVELQLHRLIEISTNDTLNTFFDAVPRRRRGSTVSIVVNLTADQRDSRKATS